MENIHNILLDLTDDEDQTNGTRLLQQLGHSSRLLISMMTCNCNQHEDPLDLVGREGRARLTYLLLVFSLLCIVVALHSRILTYAMERTVQKEGGEFRRKATLHLELHSISTTVPIHSSRR